MLENMQMEVCGWIFHVGCLKKGAGMEVESQVK